MGIPTRLAAFCSCNRLPENVCFVFDDRIILFHIKGVLLCHGTGHNNNLLILLAEKGYGSGFIVFLSHFLC